MARPQTISDQQILETALKCFLEHGPAVSTDVIAAELGVSSQAIFKRFHNKQELLIEAVKPCGDPGWVKIIEDGPDERTFQEQLSELLNELAVFFTDIVRRMELLRWSGAAIHDIMRSFDEPPPVRDIRKISSWLQRCHARNFIRDVDFDATAMIILTSMHGPAMLREFLGRNPTNHSEQEYISLYTSLLMNGLSHPSDIELNTKEL